MGVDVGLGGVVVSPHPIMITNVAFTELCLIRDMHAKCSGEHKAIK